jgi:regulator of protease activity HflC (stomatin/prohibitin superfamily)
VPPNVSGRWLLETDVKQAADAEAYRRRVLGEADRDQAKLAADAEAYRMITVAQAEAQVTKINAASDGAAPDLDPGRRGRLRQRRAGDFHQDGQAVGKPLPAK